MDFSRQSANLPWTKGVRVLKCDGNGLLAVEKPAGTLSHPNKKGDQSKALLDTAYDNKRQAYLVRTGEGEVGELLVYLLNRLDSATSGIVLLAVREATAKAVLSSFEAKKVRKTYQALVFGALRGGSPVWKDRVSVRKAYGGLRTSTGGGVLAETKLVKIEPVPGRLMISRVTLMPVTGRTHQLRIQTSKRHIPIVGDRTYGDFKKNKLAAREGLKRLCLHCAETQLTYALGLKNFSFRVASQCPF